MARCLLYYITDRSQFSGDESARYSALLAKVAEAAHAQVDYIQLREKDLSARQLEALAREVIGVVRESSPSTQVLINSRTDVALAVSADGVHLRADDIAPDEVRSIVAQVVFTAVGRDLRTDPFLVAASCHEVADVTRAQSENADFAVFAAIFGKSGVPGVSPAGIAALREACQAKIPVLALGGITIQNAAECLSAGAAGIAGIRLFQDNKIEDVGRAVRAA